MCESQGYGIGAFSYYRRITEDLIDELLDSISDLIEPENRNAYEAALAKTKTTRIAQEKIDLVKDLLPAILTPGGNKDGKSITKHFNLNTALIISCNTDPEGFTINVHVDNVSDGQCFT